MSYKTCPDWPALMELAPDLQFKHMSVTTPSCRSTSSRSSRQDLAGRRRALLRRGAPRRHRARTRIPRRRRARGHALVRGERVGDVGPLSRCRLGRRRPPRRGRTGVPAWRSRRPCASQTSPRRSSCTPGPSGSRRRGTVEEGNIAIDRGDDRLMLEWGARSTVRRTTPRSPRDSTAPVRAPLYVEAEDLPDLYAAVEGAGLRVVDPLADRPWGQTEFTVEDHEGNWLRSGSRSARDSPYGAMSTPGRHSWRTSCVQRKRASMRPSSSVTVASQT